MFAEALAIANAGCLHAACDGQALVINDAIGLGDYWPPFSRPYACGGLSPAPHALRHLSRQRA